MGFDLLVKHTVSKKIHFDYKSFIHQSNRTLTLLTCHKNKKISFGTRDMLPSQNTYIE